MDNSVKILDRADLAVEDEADDVALTVYIFDRSEQSTAFPYGVRFFSPNCEPDGNIGLDFYRTEALARKEFDKIAASFKE